MSNTELDLQQLWELMGKSTKGCDGTWNLGLIIGLEAMRDSRGRSADPWEVFTSGEAIAISSSKGSPAFLGRGGRADSIGKEDSEAFRGLKSPASLESAHMSLFQFSRSHFFLIMARTLV